MRGLRFLHRFASRPDVMEVYGSDLIYCFHHIAATSAKPELRRTAWRMGKERACAWLRLCTRVSESADADELSWLVCGCDAAERLGFDVARVKARLASSVSRCSVRDFLGFDPRREPPPCNIPLECDCGTKNGRGLRNCLSCGRALDMTSRYEVWRAALVETHMADRFGLGFGASYWDVARWLPSLRPFRAGSGTGSCDWSDRFYAVTHLVYTLNDYSAYRMSPAWLPEEFSFLKESVDMAIQLSDPEILGESLDTLASFGLAYSHPLIQRGARHLLAWQNRDGSWGDCSADNVYDRYHSTWTAVDGLRLHRWRGLGVTIAEARQLPEALQAGFLLVTRGGR